MTFRLRFSTIFSYIHFNFFEGDTNTSMTVETNDYELTDIGCNDLNRNEPVDSGKFFESLAPSVKLKYSASIFIVQFFMENL